MKNYINNANVGFKKDQFLKNLEIFRNVDRDYKKIINNYTREDGIWLHMDFILRGKDKLLLEKFNYFIGSFQKSLNMSNIFYKNNCYCYYGTRMNYEEVIHLKNNINEIICSKSFLNGTLILEAASFFIEDKFHKDNKFGVIFEINYNYRNDCKCDLFDINILSQYPGEKEVLFSIFSFYRIIDVKIDEFKKIVEVKLKSIGKEKNFELKLNNLDKGNFIHLNINKNILEI